MKDNLDGMLSPFLRRQRMRAAAPYLKGRTLDFGCGIGLVCDLVGAENYVGVDVDERVLEIGKQRYPGATFLTVDEYAKSEVGEFDRVSGLAIIEHLPDPKSFLADAARRIRDDGLIVLTTPNPALDWAHGLGAKVGVFAKESHDEHQSLMNRSQLEAMGSSVGLALREFRRFLLGANQLAIFGKIR
jgi:2-polyprenyl-3-methyl-5-hydroxy-6-metoxy-1,4-benzoquinol methylase